MACHRSVRHAVLAPASTGGPMVTSSRRKATSGWCPGYCAAVVQRIRTSSQPATGEGSAALGAMRSCSRYDRGIHEPLSLNPAGSAGQISIRRHGDKEPARASRRKEFAMPATRLSVLVSPLQGSGARSGRVRSCAFAGTVRPPRGSAVHLFHMACRAYCGDTRYYPCARPCPGRLR